jgi:PhnB protein
MILTPHLVVSGASDASAFYTKAFDAVEVMRMPEQGGNRLMHLEMKIGNQKLFICDDFPEYCSGKSRTAKSLGGTPITLHLEVADCDAAMAKAEKAGATVTMPASDMFWGDRYGQVMDPFGLMWAFSTPLKK